MSQIVGTIQKLELNAPPFVEAGCHIYFVLKQAALNEPLKPQTIQVRSSLRSDICEKQLPKYDNVLE